MTECTCESCAFPKHFRETQIPQADAMDDDELIPGDAPPTKQSRPCPPTAPPEPPETQEPTFYEGMEAVNNKQSDSMRAPTLREPSSLSLSLPDMCQEPPGARNRSRRGPPGRRDGHAEKTQTTSPTSQNGSRDSSSVVSHPALGAATPRTQPSTPPSPGV